MKIVFTGGGTGGHFFPIIAVAQEVNDIIQERNLADVDLYYFSTAPYDEAALFEQHMEFAQVPAGKLRLSRSFGNFFRNIGDIFRAGWGVMVALVKLYRVFPDVVFGKGGYASFPTLLAARILGIPVIIHESDSAPGRANTVVSKWAQKIAVSYASAAEHFPQNIRAKIAHTGQPIRREMAHPITEGAQEYLKLEPELPVVLIVGGSSGAQKINDVVWDIVPDLIQKYNVIHQVGVKNIDTIQALYEAELADHHLAQRYKPFGFLNALAQSMAAGVADLVISRAGSQLFEIAAWGVPSIIIPRTHSVNNHNMKNAYTYASTGACQVIEEKNLTPHVLLQEIERVVDNAEIASGMKKATAGFARPDAARIIAEEIIAIGVGHER